MPDLEHIILTDIYCTYWYTIDVINGRWEEAEDFIMTDSMYSYLYAVNVIKDRLPNKMHNMMLLHSIKNPNDCYVKEYFECIEFKNQLIIVESPSSK